MSYTNTIIRRWDTWDTVLQRPKKPDSLDYQIDAWGGGEAGMPLVPHPTNQGTWKAVHSLGSWGPQGSWDSLASPPKVSHRPQGTSHSCRADTKGPLSQRGFPGSLGLTEPVALNLMPHQAPRHPGEKQLESKPAGYWRSSSDALSHGPSG